MDGYYKDKKETEDVLKNIKMEEYGFILKIMVIWIMMVEYITAVEQKE